MVAQTCPNCGGSGQKWDPNSTAASGMCLSCGGTGVVWPPPVFKYEDGQITSLHVADDRIVELLERIAVALEALKK